MGQTKELKVVDWNSKYPQSFIESDGFKTNINALYGKLIDVTEEKTQALNDAAKALYWFQIVEDICNADMPNPYRETLTLGNIISACKCGVMYAEKALVSL